MLFVIDSKQPHLITRGMQEISQANYAFAVLILQRARMYAEEDVRR
jgi:hypothetical protein